MDDMNQNFPGLPFTADELTRAYLRFVPLEEAQRNAARLLSLPAEIKCQADAALELGDDAAGTIPYLHVRDEIFASLALESEELARRVNAFVNERWAHVRRSLEEGYRLMFGISDSDPLPEELTRAVDETLRRLRRTWLDCIDRVRSGAAQL